MHQHTAKALINTMNTSRHTNCCRRLGGLLYLIVSLAVLSDVHSFSHPSRVLHHSPRSQAFNRQYVLLPSTSMDEYSAFELEYYNPNEIHPKTKSLRRSAIFFGETVLQMISESRSKRKYRKLKKNLEKAKGKKEQISWRDRLRELDEQRRNLVTLADYTASIVVPSFSFLILGAFMMSVIPHFEARCVSLVATMDPSKPKLIKALMGLGISTTLCAYFTGMRGTLFWIAGTRVNYNVRVKLHRNLLLQEAAFYDSNETGYLLSRLNNDVNKIGNVVSYHVNVVFRQLAQFIFGSIYLLKIAPRLALYAFGGIALVGWISMIYGKFNRYLR